MQEFHITNEAYALVRSKAIKPFESTGRQLADGSWMVPLSDDVIEAVERKMLEGETISDTIIRLLNRKH